MKHKITVTGVRETATFFVQGRLSNDGSTIRLTKKDAVRIALELLYWKLDLSGGFDFSHFKRNGSDVDFCSFDGNLMFLNHAECPHEFVAMVRRHFTGRDIPFEFNCNN